MKFIMSVIFTNIHYKFLTNLAELIYVHVLRTQHPQDNNHAEPQLLRAGEAGAQETLPQGGAQQREAPG